MALQKSKKKVKLLNLKIRFKNFFKKNIKFKVKNYKLVKLDIFN